MTTILKDAGKLKDLIDGLIEEAIPMNLDKKLFREALDQAFSEEEEKPWEPIIGDNVWRVSLNNGVITSGVWRGDYESLKELEQGIIHPSSKSAQQFLEDYKTFLSERVKNR